MKGAWSTPSSWRTDSKSAHPYTVKMPTSNAREVKNPPVSLPIDVANSPIKNPFIIPGLRKIKVEIAPQPELLLR